MDSRLERNAETPASEAQCWQTLAHEALPKLSPEPWCSRNNMLIAQVGLLIMHSVLHKHQPVLTLLPTQLNLSFLTSSREQRQPTSWCKCGSLRVWDRAWGQRASSSCNLVPIPSFSRFLAPRLVVVQGCPHPQLHSYQGTDVVAG